MASVGECIPLISPWIRPCCSQQLLNENLQILRDHFGSSARLKKHYVLIPGERDEASEKIRGGIRGKLL